MKIDITKLRELLGEDGKPISQGDLARRCRTSQSKISRMESGAQPQEGPIMVLLEQLWDEANRARAA